MSDEPKTEIVESKKLIALRVPKGDRWRLVDDEHGVIHPTLLATLGAYARRSNYKGDFRLAPMEVQEDGKTTGKVYTIQSEVKEIVPKKIDGLNIYGEDE